MQMFSHCKTTLHVSGVTAPIFRSIKNCTSGTGHTGSMCVGVTLWYSCGGVVSVCRLKHYTVLQLQFLILLMMGAVTPEICRVVLQ